MTTSNQLQGLLVVAIKQNVTKTQFQCLEILLNHDLLSNSIHKGAHITVT